MFRLASRLGRVDASGIRKVFDLARSIQDPINLSIGLPDFDPPAAVQDAAIAAIRAGRNRYTPTQGLRELAEVVIADEQAHTGRDWTVEQTLITSGVSGGILLALLALVEDGDEVIIPDPYFVMYKQLVRMLGGTPVYLDTYATGFVPDPAQLERLITPRTRLLLLNSPANPTGRIVPAATLAAIAEVCRRHRLPVISDEIYRAFAYDGPCPSISSVYDQVLVLAGQGKTYGITGWRLGYACGPQELIQAMAKAQQYSFVCAPSFAQYAALACPQVDLGPTIAAYRAKRDLAVSLMQPHVRCGSPDGAFYLWFQAPDGIDGDRFCELALERKVLIIPGSVFSERRSHLRLSYAAPESTIRVGAAALAQVAAEVTAGRR